MPGCPTPLKQKHWSKAAAVAHLINLRRKDGAFTVHSYQCEDTTGPKHWHVGHSPKKRRPRRRGRR